MTAAEKYIFLSEEEYLEGELTSEVKHEYMNGVVEAMAGASNRHNEVAGNCYFHLRSHLKGSPCRPQNSDVKVRIPLQRGDIRFYYPDAMVVCEPNPDTDSYQEKPVVIIEVLSDSTRRIDRMEKFEAYTKLPSLDTYLLVEPDLPKVIAFQRSKNSSQFTEEVYDGLEAEIPLPSIETSLSLAEIYEGIGFSVT